jgi:hypothetical protein
VVRIESGSSVSTVTTDTAGTWSFAAPTAGVYTVSIPAGQAVLAGGSSTTTAPLVVVLGYWQNQTGVDFGYAGVCNQRQRIGGRVYCDSGCDHCCGPSGDPGIAGVQVRITKGTSTWNVVTDADGIWSFDAPTAGTYTISIPSGQAVLAGSTATTTQPRTVVLAAGQTKLGVDFGYEGACKRSRLATYTQGGWGSSPSGKNPGKLLATNFAARFPSGLVVGIGYSMKFKSASAVEAYLPAGGTASKLTGNLTNPTTSPAGVLGGQVVALKLNVVMSGPVTPAGFGTRILRNTGTSLDGKTVSQILAAAEVALGGGSRPSGYTLSKLNDLVTDLNEAFGDGQASAWALAHL